MKPVLLLMTFLYALSLKAQTGGNDTLSIDDKAYKFSAKKLIVPSVLISYGVLSLMSDDLKSLNQSTRYETREHIIAGATIDNYMQYAPAAAVYGLNLAGVKGKHNFKDRTIIYATSQLVSAALVLPTKHLVKEERPDGSNRFSFPSGHTATAFYSAHFMFREYKDTNLWLSLSGYPVAAATGIYRIFNDKHWVGDVVAGAGIGILSTEMAYWLFPMTSKWLSPKNEKQSFVILPTYQSKQIGLNLIKTF
ncbi:phosphatase PAP2 family protein [Moheibacter lacus]|uniref:Phosphatase PAP2 family protein n=1 Tax=Moheibacter lacus TaxID=2745851 RepID=A0A838ZSP2_9FLAO|nr:phosphatase PAP2 family protein [Moheibacter lacus]MBA5629997.1 phosphatase PAP2 family protein [Moheibacter lacus]